MYLSERSLATQYDISRSTVSRLVTFIREGIAEGRYPERGLLHIGGRARVDEELFRTAIIDRETERVMR